MGMGAVLTPSGQPVSNLAQRDRRRPLADEPTDRRRVAGLSVSGGEVDGLGRPINTVDLA
jgi:hypothetical protein